LLARETADPGARALHLSVNAPPPSRDQGEAGFRAAINGATAAWHTNSYVPAGVPNAWIRMTRSGNSFTGYRSSDGVNWIQFAQTNQTYTSSILVGLGVTAHDNGLLATGQFSNFTLTQPTADLAISQTARTQVRQGSNITYSITVNNGGPDAANLVKVVDTVPTGSTHISSSASQGACALAAGVVTCDLGTLVSGASATVTIVVRADATGSINNTASVSSAAVDSNAANNSATASTASYTQPQVGSTSYASSGGGSTFTMNVATLNGLNYAVEYKNSLDDATWTVLTTFPGTGAVVPVPDSTAGSVPTRFYRVVILEP